MLIAAFVGLLCNLALRGALRRLKSQAQVQEVQKTQAAADNEASTSCVFNRRQEENS